MPRMIILTPPTEATNTPCLTLSCTCSIDFGEIHLSVHWRIYSLGSFSKENTEGIR